VCVLELPSIKQSLRLFVWYSLEDRSHDFQEDEKTKGIGIGKVCIKRNGF